MNRAEQARFTRNVRVQPNECWMWTGDNAADGYGRFQSAPGKPRQMAHRWSYENHTGPIPEGMQVDHLCHTNDATCPGGSDCGHRRCVNPAHLEAVTPSENTTRQRHANRLKENCPQGHPYTDDNLIVRDGRRRCRECDRARKRRPV